jgi:hypothetical protein
MASCRPFKASGFERKTTGVMKLVAIHTSSALAANQTKYDQGQWVEATTAALPAGGGRGAGVACTNGAEGR